MKNPKIVIAMVVVLLTLAVGARAEDNPKPREARTPLVVQIVFSEYEGEKKVSSLPYTLNVSSARSSGAPKDSERVSLRMGLRVPVLVGAKDDKQNLAPNYQYENVGTDIDCTAYPVEGGTFSLNLRVARSSLYAPFKFRGATYEMAPGASQGGEKPEAPEVAAQPIFSHFNSELNLDMRDGQTIQSTVATDPISGRVLKVDVTLHVAK